MNWRRAAIWTGVAVAGVAIASVILLRTRDLRLRSVTIQGAVIRRDSDTRNELPIANAAVSATDGVTTVSTLSDASGYFKLTLKERVWPGQTIDLNFRHQEYRPLSVKLEIGHHAKIRKLYIAAMTPIAPRGSADLGKPPSVVSNVRVRYTVNSETEENIGSAVKIFQVVNRGNVPCNHQSPCSPDGNWKASTVSATLDAGPGNEFRNVRASCIAGPCPFTRIDASGFVHGGRSITASALNWSDTATFLLEAEVFRTTIDSSVRESYPVIYGRTLNFTLPTTHEGVSLEAEIDRTPMVFPLGPALYLSWAVCIVRANSEGEKSTVYRCELKPGYRF